MDVDGSSASALATAAEVLRALHRPGDPVLLPNAWDAWSGRAVEAAGFHAVATSSGAVAEALGFEDEEQAPIDEMLGAARRIARAVAIPVTVDAEAGYGLEPAALVERLLRVGAAGCNVEDTDHRHGALRDLEVHAAYLAGVRAAAEAAGVPLVVNARTDVFLGDPEPTRERMAEATRRARRYLAAGADCVYPIRLADEAAIGAFVSAVGGPVNVYLRPEAPPPARLASLGVARISLGGWLQRLAGRGLADLLDRLRAGADLFRA